MKSYAKGGMKHKSVAGPVGTQQSEQAQEAAAALASLLRLAPEYL